MDEAHPSGGPRRRAFLAGAAALIALLPMPGVARSRDRRSAAYSYDYLFLQFGKGLGHVEALVAYLEGGAASRLHAQGCEIVGVFAPWIGWSYNQAALVVRWPNGASGRARALAELRRAPKLVSLAATPMSPIARAEAGAELMQGGVYIHRWFEVPAGAAEEFAELSVQGWPDYEARFNQRIFGLFRAKATGADRAGRIERLLLFTWYRSLGDWQTTRNADRQGLFARRLELTLNMQPAATRLVWPREARSSASLNSGSEGVAIHRTE